MYSFSKKDPEGASFWVELCAIDTLPYGKTMPMERHGYQLLICNGPSGLRVIENKCSHLALPLDRGRLMGDQIICPHHGARFDVGTGCPLSGIAVRPLRTFPVSVENGRLSVQLPGVGSA